MKNFKTFMSESGIGTSHQNLAIDKNTNMAVFSDPTVIRKLNAWVGTIAGSYVIPEQAVRKLRESLSKIGLTFDSVPVMEGQSGSFELPLTLFGGRFGKDVDTPHDEFVEDVRACVVHHNSMYPEEERVPVNLVISQAIHESTWGRSRFAVEGNNLLGIRTFDPADNQLKPLNKPNVSWGLRIFETKCESIA